MFKVDLNTSFKMHNFREGFVWKARKKLNKVESKKMGEYCRIINI